LGNDEISGDASLIFQHTYLAPNGFTVLYGSSGKLALAGNDHIVGGDGNDNLYGDVKVNVGGTLYSAGHDTLEGGAGNDLLVGDVFSNARATDTTTGQATFLSAGNDILFGGESADILAGDTYSGFQEVTPGHDTFVYDFSINNGADTILDFDLGIDTLQFRNLTNVTGSAAIDTADLNALTTVTNNNGFVQLNLFSDVANTNSLGSVTLGVLGGISGISFLSGTSGDDITDYQTLGWVQVSIV
jgi:Ca2+-binding RTX toxin-like protein